MLPFILAYKNKYFRINTMKDLQVFHFENYIMVSREVKDALTKWSWTLKFHIVKMLIFPNLSYGFNTIPAKCQESFVCGK